MKRILFILCGLVFLSCEENIDIDIDNPEEELVVEGYISNNTPPFVILTKSTPYFEGTSIEDIENSYVHDATIIVSDGASSVQLQEVKSDKLTPELISFLKDTIGVDLPIDPGFIKFSFYTDLSLNPLVGEVGKSYNLRIEAEGKTLTSTTSIPQLLPLDSLFTTPHPEESKRDSFVILNATYSDPPGRGYIRYMTKVNQEPFYLPFFNSVLNDKSFVDIDGKTFSFALDRGVNRFADDIFDNYSYYEKGDTVTIRWSSIDQNHFNFWFTLENNRNQSSSPFGRPIIIDSNIDGGLGIWGGYGDSFHTIIIPRD